MLHRILLATTFLAATPVWAADFTTQAPVSAVTIYPQGAQVTRAISMDLPAGSHRILIPVSGHSVYRDPPRIEANTGATVGTITLLADSVLDVRSAELPEHAAARQALIDALDALHALQDQAELDRAAVDAAKARLHFLESVTAAGFDALDPDQLVALSRNLGAEIAATHAEIAAARPKLRETTEAIDEADLVVEQARRDLDRLTPPTEPVHMLAISVDKAAAGPVDLTLTSFVDQAGWAPSYDMRLDRDAATIAVDRKVRLGQFSGEPWLNVDLTLSTADPHAQIVPTDPQQNRAIIRDKAQPKRALSAPSPEYDRMALEAPMAEPVIVAEQSGLVMGNLQVDGLSVTYAYPEKVTVPSGDDLLQLALDSFSLDADLTIRATPRSDDTAFLLAEFRNSQPDPMLPGEVQLYRDGAFIGRGDIPLVPAGAQETVAFGALDGIRLDWRLLTNDTGDTGIIASKNRRIQSMEFSVENLTATTEDVLTLFALPFSEQEDLKLKSTASPAPDIADYEKDRGVGAWNFTLDPGQKRTVRVDVDITWPEDQDLVWRP